MLSLAFCYDLYHALKAYKKNTRNATSVQRHTFRVEVSGNEAILLVDGVQIGRASSQNTDLLSNGPISLISSLVVLRVSGLRIITL
jgi:hypothetical protein